ncbi:MAG: VWA domain-containing protein, partial [Pyrinomonadaceae bacterium]|nr:VWA domain-containing protein [Pyrinomonadaceae bacterium]
MRCLNHPARTLIFVLTLAVAFIICADLRAQETPKSSRQRLRRVNADSSQPKDTTSTTSSETQADIDDDEVLRVNTDLTNILLTAIDKERRFVTSLRREDLRVTENGVAQEISMFQRETDLPLSLAILIDASESQKGVLADEKAAALAFLDAVIRPDKDQAAIVSFTGIPLLEQPLTNDLARMRRAIERVKIILPPERNEDEEDDEASSVTQLDEEDAVGYT